MTETVTLVREDPPGVELWRCSACGEVKRWCPCCDQGWVLLCVINRNGQSIYVCQECDATWTSSRAIGSAGDSLQPFREGNELANPWQEVTSVKDYDL